MEVSFPNEHAQLARVSGHHTPETLQNELPKLHDPDLPVLLYHIKPVYYDRVTKELAAIPKRDLTILQLDDQFVL